MPYAGYFARRRWNQWHPARDISRRLGVLDVLGWIQDPADGKFYMWAASMAHNCTMGEWQTNSEVVLASVTFPMGPYEKVKTVVMPWAHNPRHSGARQYHHERARVRSLHAGRWI